ncbi:MAG TPA: hypothetical protein VF784_12855 [Anaerolineales bacterium]
MEISLLALIGIGLATMFFGYFFGLFEGRGQGYKKRKSEEASDPSLRPAAPPPPAPDNSVLKLSLDSQKQPRLDMDGRRIDTTQIAPEQRRRLIELMVLMRPWIDASPVQKTPAAAPATAPQPAPQPVSVQAPSREAARPAPVPASLTPAPAAQPPAPTEPASKPTTMVGQIDAILQSNLAGTPLATRGIRLVESAQGGAMVMVGLSRYTGVGEVPDPEVQAVIRAAIAEWEKKYTPG